MTKFTYKKVIYNHVLGYIAIRWIDNTFAGQQFGKTKQEARAKFDEVLA
jgi:hypothetical protein